MKQVLADIKHYRGLIRHREGSAKGGKVGIDSGLEFGSDDLALPGMKTRRNNDKKVQVTTMAVMNHFRRPIGAIRGLSEVISYTRDHRTERDRVKYRNIL